MMTNLASFFSFLRRMPPHFGISIGLLFITLATAGAVFAPMLVFVGPFAMAQKPLDAPGAAYWFGTDDLGRDIYSGVLYGGRVSLAVGFLAALTSTVLGMFVGSIAGFFSGYVDDLLMRITELFQIVPRFFLAIVVVALFGSSIWYVIGIIGILSWPETARLVRSQALTLKELDFIDAAVSLGASRWRILFHHILPNALSSVIISGSIQVARAILLESSLSFLGLGDPNHMSWGRMLGNAQQFLQQAWWMVVFPGVAIFSTAFGFQLLGDGLNDLLNPKTRRALKAK